MMFQVSSEIGKSIWIFDFHREKVPKSYPWNVECDQGDEVGESNERCPLTSNFDASEAERAFYCHI